MNGPGVGTHPFLRSNQRKVTVDPHRAYNKGKSFIRSMANALIGKDVSTGITIFYHSRCRLRCGCGLLKNNNNEHIPGLTESYNHEEICARDDGSSVNLLVIAEVFVAFVKVKICQC